MFERSLDKGEMRKEIDFLEIGNLSSRISEVAEKASVIAKRLQKDDISEEENDRLGRELNDLISLGSDLSSQRDRVFRRSELI